MELIGKANALAAEIEALRDELDQTRRMVVILTATKDRLLREVEAAMATESTRKSILTLIEQQDGKDKDHDT